MSKKARRGPPKRLEVPDKLYFRIGEVAQLVDVDSHVLRYWEKEFKLKPHRSPSGQRLYQKQDLSMFLRIKHLLHDDGYTIAGARKVLSSTTKTAVMINPSGVRDALQRVTGLREEMSAYRAEILTGYHS